MHLEATDPAPAPETPETVPPTAAGKGGKQSGGCQSLYRHSVTKTT